MANYDYFKYAIRKKNQTYIEIGIFNFFSLSPVLSLSAIADNHQHAGEWCRERGGDYRGQHRCQPVFHHHLNTHHHCIPYNFYFLRQNFKVRPSSNLHYKRNM